MFRKMLVCTDLSPASDALIQCVGELKRVGMEEAVLTHVNFLATTPGVEEICTEETSPILQHQKSVLEDQNIRVTVEMPCGLPAHAIAETAERHGVSAILIGTHGKGRLQAATLGSVSAQVLQQARRPVLLVRIALIEEGKSEAVCGGLFRNIFFPTDFSRTAEMALDYLGKIAHDTRCPVTVMHVAEQHAAGQPDTRYSGEDAGFLLESKVRRLRELGGADAAAELVHGNPAAEILRRIKEGDFSIIIMGGHGKGIVKELILGSVANEVSRKADIPVLFIPAACSTAFPSIPV